MLWQRRQSAVSISFSWHSLSGFMINDASLGLVDGKFSRAFYPKPVTLGRAAARCMVMWWVWVRTSTGDARFHYVRGNTGAVGLFLLAVSSVRVSEWQRERADTVLPSSRHQLAHLSAIISAPWQQEPFQSTFFFPFNRVPVFHCPTTLRISINHAFLVTFQTF